MNAIRKSLVFAAAAVSAFSMLGGTAFAGGDGAAAAEEGINLVQNGNFVGGTGPWTPGEDTVLVLKNSTGEVINTAPRIFQTTAMATQCVAFDLGASPKFFGTIKIPEGQVRTGSAHFRLTFFENSDCTDFNGSVALNSVTETGQTQQFHYQPDAWMAGEARSVLIQLVVVKNQSLLKHKDDPFAARFDSVALLVAPPPPANEEPHGPAVACVVGDAGCDDEDDGPAVVCKIEDPGCGKEPVVHQPTIVPPTPPAPPTGGGAKEPAPLPGSGDDQSDEPSGAPALPGSDQDGGQTSGTPGDGNSGNGSQAGGANPDGSNPGNGTTTASTAPTAKPGTTGNANQGGAAGGPSAKPSGNAGSPEQTPLAPATGSDALTSDDSQRTNPVVFGAAAGAMALASIFFVLVLRRRKASHA